MKQLRLLAAGLLGLGTLAFVSGTAAAEQVSVVQELHVTATVLPMRHIIVDPAGKIVRVTSNTLDDVTPEVYLLQDIPGNKRELTKPLYTQYRQVVPAGTAKYGTLYQQQTAVATLSAINRIYSVGIFQNGS